MNSRTRKAFGAPIRILVRCMLGAILLLGSPTWAQTPLSKPGEVLPIVWPDWVLNRTDQVLITPSMGMNGQEVDVQVGQTIRMDPAAYQDGWRLNVQGLGRHLWPLNDKKDALVARCPGEMQFLIENAQHAPPPSRAPEPVPSSMLQLYSTRILHFRINIREGAKNLAVCNLPFEPRDVLPNPGVLTYKDYGKAIVLRVDEEVLLPIPEPCVSSWRYELSGTGVVVEAERTRLAVKLRAVTAGSVLLRIKMPLDCYLDAGNEIDSPIMLFVQ